MGSRSRKRIGRAAALAGAALLSLSLASVRSWATPVQDSWLVRFDAPVQDLYGGALGESPPPLTEDVEVTSGPLTGSRLALTVNQDLGSVRASVEGSLTALHQDVVAPGSTQIEFKFDGVDGASRLRTSLAVNFLAEATLRFGALETSGVVGPIGLDFATDTNFTYGTATTTDALSRADLDVFDLSLLGTGLTFGVSLDHEMFFQPDSILGTVMATHLDSGFSFEHPFQARDGAFFANEIDLDRRGFWFLELVDLELRDNDFWHQLGGTVSIAGTVLGIEVLDLQAGVNFFTFPSFALAFDDVDALGGGFLMEVVPEPATSALLVAGLVAVFASARGGSHAADRRTPPADPAAPLDDHSLR